MSETIDNLFHMPYELYDKVKELIGHSPLNKSVDNIVTDMEHAEWDYYDIFWFLVYFYYEEEFQEQFFFHHNHICNERMLSYVLSYHKVFLNKQT